MPEGTQPVATETPTERRTFGGRVRVYARSVASPVEDWGPLEDSRMKVEEIEGIGDEMGAKLCAV